MQTSCWTNATNVILQNCFPRIFITGSLPREFAAKPSLLFCPWGCFGIGATIIKMEESSSSNGRHLVGGRCQRNGKWQTKPFRFLLLSYYYYLTFKRRFHFPFVGQSEDGNLSLFRLTQFCSWVAVAHFWWKEKFFLRNNRTNHFPRRIFQFGTPFPRIFSAVSKTARNKNCNKKFFPLISFA